MVPHDCCWVKELNMLFLCWKQRIILTSPPPPRDWSVTLSAKLLTGVGIFLGYRAVLQSLPSVLAPCWFFHSPGSCRFDTTFASSVSCQDSPPSFPCSLCLLSFSWMSSLACIAPPLPAGVLGGSHKSATAVTAARHSCKQLQRLEAALRRISR